MGMSDSDPDETALREAGSIRRGISVIVAAARFVGTELVSGAHRWTGAPTIRIVNR